MIVYSIMFLISVLFSFLAYSNGKHYYRRMIYTIIAFLPFIIVASVRYDVGTDYMFRNVPDYQNMVLGNDVPNLEPLFKIIIRFCILFSKDYVILFVVTSIIMYTLFAITVGKYSKNIILSIIVFVFGTYYFKSLNLVRQFLGMSVMFFAYRYILDKKYIKWFICLVIATLLHTSCLLYIITLFFDKKVFKLRYLIILIVLILTIGYPALVGFLSILGKFGNANINKYYNYVVYGDRGMNYSEFIPEVLIFIYFYYIYCKKKDKMEKEGIFFINLQFVSILVALMNIYNSLFSRILVIFSFFQIISIPYFWSFYHDGKNITYKNKSIITVNTLCCICILGILLFKMFYTVIIKGNGEVLPYKTIWDRDKIERRVN